MKRSFERFLEWLRARPERQALVSGVVVLVALLLWTSIPKLFGDHDTSVPLSTLVAQLSDKQVSNVDLDSKAQVAKVTLVDNKREKVTYTTQFEPELIKELQAAGTKYKVTAVGSPGGDGGFQWSSLLLPIAMAAGLALYALHKEKEEKFEALTPAEIPAVRFDDVVGADEVLDECRQIVRCLRRPRWFRLLGVRPLTGMLIYGPPGAGKTLLARAIAGEAGAPFYAVGGSDFQEKYAGVGAARVRRLFADARRHQVAIIFVDEIDSVGGKRGDDTDSGTVGYNQTVNALLAAMDGFAGKRTGPLTIVIGATNAKDRIDPALTRPGRLTRQLAMPVPDRKARLKILKMYAEKLPNIEPDADFWDELATLTSGMTGADLAQLVNQAGLTAELEHDATLRAQAEAAGKKHDPDDIDETTTHPGFYITQHHFLSALESAQMGPERRSIEVALRDRQVTAVHEAGHAVAGRYAPVPLPPRKVTIVPRGSAGGVTWATSGDEQLPTRGELLSRLIHIMGARAAERLVFGDQGFTVGAHDDLQQATKLATAMVCELGMVDEYPAALPLQNNDPRHEAVQTLLRTALADAMTIVTAHRATIDLIAAQLLEHETLGEAELSQLLPA